MRLTPNANGPRNTRDKTSETPRTSQAARRLIR
jgi:hypothetical protein